MRLLPYHFSRETILIKAARSEGVYRGSYRLGVYSKRSAASDALDLVIVVVINIYDNDLDRIDVFDSG